MLAQVELYKGAIEGAKAQAEVRDLTQRLLSVQGKRTVDDFHRELGKIMWSKCGMARDEKGLLAAIAELQGLREEFWRNVRVLGDGASVNQSLEKAGRVADFLEFGELMCRDALERRESCGGHFREEWQDDGEARRDDENFCHVAVWEHKGAPKDAVRHQEPLVFENVHLAVRSYK